MNYPTPAAASAAGQLLWIEIDNAIRRPMSHVFMLTAGGLAWVDHGWTDGLGGGHPCHHIRGEVRPDGERWLLTTTDEDLLDRSGGEPLLIRAPITADPKGRPDGGRDEARALLVADQGIELAVEI